MHRRRGPFFSALTSSLKTAQQGRAYEMTREVLKSRWTIRRNELRETDAWVNGAKLCDQLLADLERLWTEEDSTELTLGEAARASGYSGDHLRRLARRGALAA